jgi:hypothetical protein
MTAGMSPLKDVMKELQVRNVHIFPRYATKNSLRISLSPNSTSFHEDIKQSLERRRADVVQIAVPMTEMMRDIHVAIIQCIEAVLGDLKRSHGDVRSSSSYVAMSLIEAVEPRRSECTLGIFSKFQHDCPTATEPSLASHWPSYETACRRFEYATAAIAVRLLSAF